MNFEIHFDDFHHAPTTMIALLNYLLFALLFVWIYRTNETKPRVWKAFLVMFFGLFVFSINFNFNESLIQLPILPLGVWIILWICKRKDNQYRWAKYRRFAWAGFLIRFIHLVTVFLIQPIDTYFYPKDQLETFISDVNRAKILPINMDTKQVRINRNLNEIIHNAKQIPFDGMKWEREIIDSKQKEERFPFILVGTNSKAGSNLNPTIFIERNGKGILVSTKEGQYYFQSDNQLFSPLKGGGMDEK